MNREVMKKWVAALRSGEYMQANGELRVANEDGSHSYCCLGVLCELHRKEHNADGSDYHYQWESLPSRLSGSHKHVGAYANHTDNLPHSVRQWAGLRQDDPTIYVADEDADNDESASAGEHDITYLNDDRRWPFTQLADIIEDQWEDL